VRVDAWRMVRKRWSVGQKRRIVELTLVPGASVARVAQTEGVIANQVFLCRRAYQSAELQAADSTLKRPLTELPLDPLGAGRH
jgi:transposase-like protein